MLHIRYGLYGVMTMWPPEIRQDLRSGLLAKRRGDLDTSSQYLTRYRTPGLGIFYPTLKHQNQSMETSQINAS